MLNEFIGERSHPDPGKMNHLLRPAVIITLFSLSGMAISFVNQIVIAALFGAGAEMDAYLAANTLPQYVIYVIFGALAFVFIPLFMEYTTTGRKEEAWKFASTVINLSMIILAGLALCGMAFAKPLLRITTPGLSDASNQLAVQVALITWPSILAIGLSSLLIGIYQACGRFIWPVAVPIIGALVNLGMIILLAPLLGVIGLAIAAATNVLLQAIFLSRVILQQGRYRISFDWKHPAVVQLFFLIGPLVLAGLFQRCMPVIERFLASGLAEGSISHLGYAFRFQTLAMLLLNAGITTVLYPRMAHSAAYGDNAGLRHTASFGLRIMWIAVAPTIAIGAALVFPLITVLLQRGAFNANDAHSVASLTRIYLFTLSGACLGNITGRLFYVLKITRILGLLGVLETVAFAIYAPLLVHKLGVSGVALSYVLFYNISLSWQLPILRHKLGNNGGRKILQSFMRTAAAAAVGGLATWVMTMTTSDLWLKLIFGALVGLVVYIALLMGMKSTEIWKAWAYFFNGIKNVNRRLPFIQAK